MITLDELAKIMRAARNAANKRGEVYDGWDMDRAGAVAVVRALEPVIAHAWFDGEELYGRSREGKPATERMAKLYAEYLVQKILGDTTTGDAGVSEESAETTSPASFCEWALQKRLKRLPHAYIFKKSCDGLRSTVSAKKKICHRCSKPIKFMAELPK